MSKTPVLVYIELVKPVLFLLSAFLFVSCAGRDASPGIQDIVERWNGIDRLFARASEGNFDSGGSAALLEACDAFYQSLEEFQTSDLYRIYRAISFLPRTERTFNNYSIRDIEEVGIVLDLALIFRYSIVQGDMENAGEASAEISRHIIRLLIIDGEAQRYISSSYFNLLIALLFFIAIIALLIRLLHQSLVRSLKRETETIIFSHAWMLAQDEERARISRELHDTIIQDMRCLHLEMEKLNPPPQAALLQTAGLIRKTRDICNSLVPPDFRFSELPDALRQLCFDFGEKTGINCRAEIDGNVKLDFLSMEKRLQLYRIVQEALINIEKHAGAKEAIVTMRRSEDIVYVGIGDDGKGFKPPLDDSGQIIYAIDKSHLGIVSMKERAAILGGRLKIVSAPQSIPSAPAGASETGEGALVCLEIPASRENFYPGG